MTKTVMPVIVPETEDLNVAKEGDVIHHWAVFPSSEDWTVLGTFETEDAAKDFAESIETRQAWSLNYRGSRYVRVAAVADHARALLSKEALK